RGPLAEAEVYTRAPGAVARCVQCGEVVLRLVGGGGRAGVGPHGPLFVELRPPARPGPPPPPPTRAVPAVRGGAALAVVRPRGWPEAVAAVPAAVLVVAAGALPLSRAVAEVVRLAPVAGFLAAVLVLAQLCADEGLFEAAGGWLARADGPRRLLALV